MSPQFIGNVLVIGIYILYWSTVFIIFYHLTRFGVGTLPKKFAAIFLLGSVILFLISVLSYVNIDIISLIPTM